MEETPAEQKPEGDNVQWIAGYWAWDDARSDFLWVSGFWRVPPPGRAWVPGSWRKTDAGFQWVGGVWTPAAQPDMQYLPQPPASIEAGPTIPAPTADHVYVPGTWVYSGYRYAWRPGVCRPRFPARKRGRRSEREWKEHTSELQSPDHLVCRLLL